MSNAHRYSRAAHLPKHSDSPLGRAKTCSRRAAGSARMDRSLPQRALATPGSIRARRPWIWRADDSSSRAERLFCQRIRYRPPLLGLFLRPCGLARCHPSCRRYRLAVSEFHRVLRPGGLAIVMVYPTLAQLPRHDHVAPEGSRGCTRGARGIDLVARITGEPWSPRSRTPICATMGFATSRVVISFSRTTPTGLEIHCRRCTLRRRRCNCSGRLSRSASRSGTST